MIQLILVLRYALLRLMTKWVWFHKNFVYIAAAIKIWKGSKGMSESEHSGQKYIITVAGIIAGVVLLLGLAGVGLTLST